MNKVAKVFEHLVNVFMAGSLALMVILVFTNVVLRYAFNSGLNSAEEASRFLFIGLTFLGAIFAFKDNEHLGVNSLVRFVPPFWKKVMVWISYLLMFAMCGLIFQGSWKLILINLHSKAPATGLSLSFMYVTGLIMSVAIALIILVKLYLLAGDKISVEKLTELKESEEELSDIHQPGEVKEVNLP